MKTFIFNLNKYKKWITLGLSVLSLLLFCFPLVSFTTVASEDAYEASYIILPFILSLPFTWSRFSKVIKTIDLYDANHRAEVITYVVQNTMCSVLLFICFILAILCLIRQFKGKKFYFLPSIIFAFLTMLVAGIYNSYHSAQGVEYITYKLDFYPSTAIFLALLILDIVYLILEKHYLRPDYDQRLADRRATKQAKAEAEYKQSNEYRIEQLEKELQELKAKNEDKDVSNRVT